MTQLNLGAISVMRLPELREAAKSLGLDVDPKAKKADLVAAIRSVTGPARRGRPSKAHDAEKPANSSRETTTHEEAGEKPVRSEKPEGARGENFSREDRRDKRERPARVARNDAAEESGEKPKKSVEDIVLPDRRDEGEAPRRDRDRGRNRNRRDRDRGRNREERENTPDSEKRAALEAIGDAAERKAGDDRTDAPRDRNRNRNRRDRDRNRNERNNSLEPREGEELLPVAGILDFEGNNAFLRTGGYLPGANDAAVPPQIVKQYGLRRGDAIVGAVRVRGEGEQPQNRGPRGRRFNQHNSMNQLLQVDSINSLGAEDSLARPEFQKLTPLYPQEMLRLETSAKAMTPRAIDLVAPIGKGQRGLIVAPPKAGKTMVMQQIAMAIAQNNPRVHLMVVLVDERPEEVTDMKRLVKGEVIASTFDRPASDHTIVAELAIERAKRLVELGQDVVVLLDSITRLSRAYNLAAPASGRILSGGVDAAALYPPKKFFGAARNIENGGSLTIIASALVETGSKMDEVIFEEFKGTGNMELRLSRQLADRRIFPAIDVNASGTRREELLFNPDELKVIWQLRRALGTLDVAEASDFMLGRLRKTENNAEFLVSILKSMQASASQNN